MNDFRVLESERWPSSSYFAEFYPLAGPAAVADIGNGSQRERYGWNWLVFITRDRVAEAYQERPAASGEWHLVTDLMPPVFGTVLPEGSRRLTAVFDQSGRMIIAYEHAGLVRVTRWDVETQQYVQNVTFPGVNPALTIDLQAGINPSDSDVLLFYQPDGDLTQVHCRVQRELYLTPHVVHSGAEELILDRAQVNSMQLELLVSDVTGSPLRDESGQLKVLASPYYPRFVQDNVILDAQPTTAIYEETTLVRGVEDAVWLDATVLNPEGLSGEPIYEHVPRSFTDYSGIGAVPTDPPNEGMENALLLRGSRLTAKRLYWHSVNWPSCFNAGGEAMPVGEWMIGTPGSGLDIEDQRHLVFDAVIKSENLVAANRYGIRGLSVIFETLWVITRESISSQAGDPLEPAVMYSGQPDPNPSDVCLIEGTWQAGPRTIVAEVAQSAQPIIHESHVFEWIEVWRTTEEPPQVGWTQHRQYSFNADISMLASDTAPFVHVRLRTLDSTGNNSTHVYLLGGWHVQLDMLSNAFVSNVLQRSVQDAVVLDATPTVAEYRDNTHLESVQDAVVLDATPTTAEYVLHIAANPQPVDHVILDATPTVAIYREVP